MQFEIPKGSRQRNNESMLFTDEESRHSYHKAPALLQAACQILETYAASYGTQAELIDCERQSGLWIAAIGLDDQLPEEALIAIAEKVNRTFARTDELETCTMENAEVCLFSLRVSDRFDYAQLT